MATCGPEFHFKTRLFGIHCKGFPLAMQTQTSTIPTAPSTSSTPRLIPTNGYARFSVKISLLGRALDLQARASELPPSNTMEHEAFASSCCLQTPRYNTINTLSETKRLESDELEHLEISLPTLEPFSLILPLRRSGGSGLDLEAQPSLLFNPQIDSQATLRSFEELELNPICVSPLTHPLSSSDLSHRSAIERTASPSPRLSSTNYEFDPDCESDPHSMLSGSVPVPTASNRCCPSSPGAVANQVGVRCWPGSSPFSFIDDSANDDVYFGDDEDEWTERDDDCDTSTIDRYDRLQTAPGQVVSREGDGCYGGDCGGGSESV